MPTDTQTERSQLDLDVCNRLVKQLNVLQATLSDEHRLELWSELTFGFCRECGRKLGFREVCRCPVTDDL